MPSPSLTLRHTNHQARALRRSACGVALALAGFAACAADAPVPPPPPADALPAATPRLPPEPNVVNAVSEDDHVRVDELRVRGQTQSIVVHPKIKGLDIAPYEIITNNTGRDLGGAADGRSGDAGARVWHVFGF